ncbi:MAG: hypothetical protein U0871_02335 [Gemmataceae bacterium]
MPATERPPNSTAPANRLLLIRFPGRSFVFVGDSGYGTHEVARFCHRHRDRLTWSASATDVNLFHPPPLTPVTGSRG